ncbi:hypothetical protein V5799_010552, partial [Amblyomma americanum]
PGPVTCEGPVSTAMDGRTMKLLVVLAIFGAALASSDTSCQEPKPASSSSTVVARRTETTSQRSKNVRATVVELQDIWMERHLE